MTEVDRYDARASAEGDPDKLAEERVKMFRPHLVFRESTPTRKGLSRIGRHYGESDQRRYHVPCPRCGHYQELRFWPHREGPWAGRGGLRGLKDARGEWLTPEAARGAAWYACEACGAALLDEEKTPAIERGLWVPAGQDVDAAGNLVGMPRGDGRHAGFHLSTLYAPSARIRFGDVAAEYLASRGQPRTLQSFVNNWLGLEWEDQLRATEWRTLRDRLSTAIPRGQVHPEAVFLTCGVDVQGVERGIFYVVRAWWAREGQCTSCLVDAGPLEPRRGPDGEILRGSDLDQLDSRVLDRPWPYLDAGRDPLSVRLLLVDTGYAARHDEVYAWVRARPGDRVRAIKGFTRQVTHWRRAALDRSPVTGKSFAAGLALWLVNVDLFKADLQGRWETPPERPGAWCLHAHPSESYLRQIANEGLTIVERADGSKTEAWRPRDPSLGVDYWDCEVYARGGAEMIVGLHGWSRLEEQAAAQKPRQRDAARDAPRPRIERPGGWARR
jgi:phage terminase large subunit GpA-like protein